LKWLWLKTQICCEQQYATSRTGTPDLARIAFSVDVLIRRTRENNLPLRIAGVDVFRAQMTDWELRVSLLQTRSDAQENYPDQNQKSSQYEGLLP